MTSCKNKCIDFKQETKHQVYQNGGCYCRLCDYYFKEYFLRCPCCNLRTRNKTRTNRGRDEL